MRVVIAVTHLLGAGHLTRAAALARAFDAAGHAVTLVSGGFPAPHVDLAGLDLVQLPPLRSDGTRFTRLLGEDGSPAGPALMEARRAALETRARQIRPDVLITELFPFGRRMLAVEFEALLQATHDARPDCIRLASVRDILAPPSRPEKAERTAQIVAEHYDAVLVHSDPAIMPLERSWPVTPEIAARLRYTGFVVPPGDGAPGGASIGGEIVVSAGGGPVGRPLFEAALGAARAMPARRWRLLVGGRDGAITAAELARGAPDNALVEPARRDFRALLARAAASVSLSGYNTAMDILMTGVPAVIVPFDAGGETEQTLRAEALARLDGIEPLAAARLDATTLGAALSRVLAAPGRAPGGFRHDGAAESVRIAARLADRRAAGR